MILSLYDVDYNNKIPFEDGYVISLECESVDYFIKLISDVKGGTSNAIKVFCGDDALDLGKDAITIIDYYSLEQYEKTLFSKFYKTLDKKFITDSTVIDSLNQVAKLFENITYYLTEDLNAKFEINMPSLISDYAKFCDLKIEGGFSSGIEGMLNFINVLSILKTHRLLILVNAKSFFNKNEVCEIIKYCTYNNIKTLFIDTKTSANHYDNEIKLLIDNDFYDILYK